MVLEVAEALKLGLWRGVTLSEVDSLVGVVRTGLLDTGGSCSIRTLVDS